MIKCANCGFEIKEGLSFCMQCGEKVASPASEVSKVSEASNASQNSEASPNSAGLKAAVNDYSENYDIFLSYRRDGGDAMATLLRDRLTAKGYSVFLDVENLSAGSFNSKLFDVIDNCKDVLLICSKNCLDRCVNDGDWVRMEIARALEKNKNIIPFFLRDFDFPEVLPPDVEEIRVKNGVDARSYEYFNVALDRLTSKFFKSQAIITQTAQVFEPSPDPVQAQIYALTPKKPFKKRKAFLIALIGVFSVALIATASIIIATNANNGVGNSGKYESVADKDYALKFENDFYYGSYTGDWLGGKPNGQGEISMKEYHYKGGWKDGRPHGFGKEEWLVAGEGYVYEGEFKDGVWSGEGKVVFESGKIQEGEFKNDALYNGSVKDGNKITRVVDGEMK